MHCKSLWIKASAKCINVNTEKKVLYNFKGKKLTRNIIILLLIIKTAAISCLKHTDESGKSVMQFTNL